MRVQRHAGLRVGTPDAGRCDEQKDTGARYRLMLSPQATPRSQVVVASGLRRW